jgi:hypothetical protein
VPRPASSLHKPIMQKVREECRLYAAEEASAPPAFDKGRRSILATAQAQVFIAMCSAIVAIEVEHVEQIADGWHVRR